MDSALTGFICCAVIVGFTMLPANAHSPDFTSGAYFGCFRDIGQYSTFAKHANITKREPDSCRERCRNESLTYIGLWGGGNCWCAVSLYERTTPNRTNSNGLLEKVNDSQCIASCADNSTLSCGGFTDEAENNIYSVYSVCPKTKYGTKHCKQSCNCKDGNHCSVEGICPGNVCAPGWKWNITNNRARCNADVDECKMECNSTHTSNCYNCSARPNERCRNTYGGYECICESGYHNTSEGCNDVDECELNKGGCQHHCNNILGSFSCSCPPGFRNTSDSTNEETNYNCIDIDECCEGSSNCVHNCTNTIGSYACSCHAGFQLQEDRFSCKAAEAECESSASAFRIGFISSCCVIVILIAVIIVMYIERRRRLSANANQASRPKGPITAQPNIIYESIDKDQRISGTNEAYEELNLTDRSIQTGHYMNVTLQSQDHSIN